MVNADIENTLVSSLSVLSNGISSVGIKNPSIDLFGDIIDSEVKHRPAAQQWTVRTP